MVGVRSFAQGGNLLMELLPFAEMLPEEVDLMPEALLAGGGSASVF